MLALQEYASSSDDENVSNDNEDTKNVETEANHLKPIENPEFSVKKQLQICAAPLVVPTVSKNKNVLEI